MLDRKKYLRHEEQVKLLDSLEKGAIVGRARGHRVPVRDYYVFLVALASGLRPGELVECSIGNLKIGRSDVLLTVRRLKKRQELIEEVHLPAALRSELQSYLAWLETAGLPTGDDAPLFPNHQGRRMTTNGLWQRWNEALEAAGLPHRALRATRHTLGTQLYRKTKDLRLVQKQLGHSRPETTAIYADVLDEDMKKGVNDTWSRE